MADTANVGQSGASIASNAKYFLEHLQEYEKGVAEIDTYRTIHGFISKEVSGVKELLDVGNGGVFAYDTSVVGAITALDLFLEDIPPVLIEKYFPRNARPLAGSALDIPAPDDKYEMVLMVMLLHHLTGNDWRSSWKNACTALDEAWRVLQPGGRLLIVESCVPNWTLAIEKPALWILSRLIKSVFSHPITFQFTASMIAEELRKKTELVEVISIPKGKFVLQLGFKTPSFLTPVQVYGITATKKP
jgi:SAM-dependent methyltransferase